MRRVLLYVLGALARGARLAPEDLVVVVHSGSVENATTARRLPWLPADSRHVIVGGATGDDRDFGADRRRRSLMFVNYDDNPGCARSVSRKSPCTDPTYERIGKYYGAHRTVAGVFVANVTWPDAEWVLVCDDDNYVDLDTVRAYLGALDAGVPLLLAGRVGPGRDSVPCRPSNNATHWSCCTDASVPCYAHVSGPQAVWDYDASRGTFAPEKVCPDHETAPYCCRTAPWPQGISRGFPYRLDGDGSYRPHFAKLWPYGGAGYALSRGLLDAIPAAHWEARGRAESDRLVFGVPLRVTSNSFPAVSSDPTTGEAVPEHSFRNARVELYLGNRLGFHTGVHVPPAVRKRGPPSNDVRPHRGLLPDAPRQAVGPRRHPGHPPPRPRHARARRLGDAPEADPPAGGRVPDREDDAPPQKPPPPRGPGLEDRKTPRGVDRDVCTY